MTSGLLADRQRTAIGQPDERNWMALRPCPGIDRPAGGRRL